MKSDLITRRNFLGKTAVTAGLSVIGAHGYSNSVNTQVYQSPRLPREVWIATVSQMGLKAKDTEGMIKMILGIVEKAIVYQPDIICLPEVFSTTHLETTLDLQEKVEIFKTVLTTFSAFAKQNNCYVICPGHKKENGKIYNSAVVFNRKGEEIGDYRKIHITENEIAAGITPGPLDPPVFETDFGTIGIQICFDMLWDDGWKAIKEKGADIVFWPAAYAGGETVNTKAWRNNYVVVSSTGKNTAKICDISGDVITQTGVWDRNLICAPVNLEKAFVHAWPAVIKFDKIRKKYGRKIKITNYHEEEWSIIESLSPDIKVKDILDEFEIKSYDQLKNDAENAQNKARI